MSERGAVRRDATRGSKSAVAVANYVGPKYFRSDSVRREMERRESGEGGGAAAAAAGEREEGSRSRIRVFAPSGAVDTSTRARHAWLVRESREAPRIGGYILVSP
jgi:hypothetical protein